MLELISEIDPRSFEPNEMDMDLQDFLIIKSIGTKTKTNLLLKAKEMDDSIQIPREEIDDHEAKVGIGKTMVSKTTRGEYLYQNGIHDIFVSHFVINAFRDAGIPNFPRCYSYEIDPEKKYTRMFIEKLDMVDINSLTIKERSEIVLQTILALACTKNVKTKICGEEKIIELFCHADLHNRNLAIVKMEERRDLEYKTEFGTFTVSSEYLAVIIDFDFSVVKISGKWYGLPTMSSEQNYFPEQMGEFVDIIKLIYVFGVMKYVVLEDLYYRLVSIFDGDNLKYLRKSAGNLNYMSKTKDIPYSISVPLLIEHLSSPPSLPLSVEDGKGEGEKDED